MCERNDWTLPGSPRREPGTHAGGTRVSFRLPIPFLALVLLAGCAPSPAAPGATSTPPVPAAPSRTLVAALRVEPNSVAAKPIGSGGVATYLATRLFNADFAQLDDDGVALP